MRRIKMNNALQNSTMPKQVLLAQALPILSTVNNLPSYFASANLTPAKIRSQIFKSVERFDSRGDRILGNGLEESGAIIRRKGTRSLLIDVTCYGNWLSGKESEHETSVKISKARD